MAVAAYCIGYENDLQKEKTKVKRELKGKIEKLVVYKTKREYQGTFIDSDFVSGDCGSGAPSRGKEKSEVSKPLYCGDCGRYQPLKYKGIFAKIDKILNFRVIFSLLLRIYYREVFIRFS